MKSRHGQKRNQSLQTRIIRFLPMVLKGVPLEDRTTSSQQSHGFFSWTTDEAMHAVDVPSGFPWGFLLRNLGGDFRCFVFSPYFGNIAQYDWEFVKRKAPSEIEWSCFSVISEISWGRLPVAIINHSFEIGKEQVAWIYALCQMLACIGIGHGLWPSIWGSERGDATLSHHPVVVEVRPHRQMPNLGNWHWKLSRRSLLLNCLAFWMGRWMVQFFVASKHQPRTLAL